MGQAAPRQIALQVHGVPAYAQQAHHRHHTGIAPGRGATGLVREPHIEVIKILADQCCKGRGQGGRTIAGGNQHIDACHEGSGVLGQD